MATGQYGPEDLGVGIAQRAYRRTDRLPEVGQDASVQLVALGELAGGPGRNRAPALAFLRGWRTVINEVDSKVRSLESPV